MKLVLLRHGESIANTWHHAYKHDDFNFLTMKGVKQAELAGHEIDELLPEIDHVYTSQFTRAMHTASTVMQTNDSHRREYIVDARLNEWWDDSRGKTPTEFHEQVAGFYEDVILDKWSTDAHILVVSHYYTTGVLIEKLRMEIGHQAKHRDLNELGMHVPNAMPFYFDTNRLSDVEMIIPGFGYHKT